MIEAQNVSLAAGDNMVITVTVTQAGSAKNLTGATAINYKAYPLNSSTAVITKALLSGVTVTNAAGGIFTVTLAPADTTALCGDYRHEAEITDVSGNISTVMTGLLSVQKVF